MTLLVFDCDGVLVDSEPLSMRVDVQILAENGVTISVEEAHRRFVGKTFAAMLDEIAEVPNTGGVLLTFDDFIEGVEAFGQRIQPLMKSRRNLAAAA